MDILAAGNGKVAIIHGAYPENRDSRTEQSAALRSGQVESLTEGFNVSAVRVGNFVWDRENRPEIALLSGDGSIRILERGKLDKRPFTESENKSRIFKHRELMNQEEEIRNLDYQPRTSKPRREKWIESDLEKIRACVERLLTATGSDSTEINRVFLTGGSSLVPAVRKIFADRFGAERISGGSEFTSVAKGLALRALAEAYDA
jgi:hypothetical protein